MKTIKETLLLFITSMMCIFSVFGCSSIVSKAASNEAATEVRFEGDHVHFKTISEGYYACMIANSQNGSKDKIFFYGYISDSNLDNPRLGTFQNVSLKANETIDYKGCWNYNQLGKMTLYVLYSSEPITLSSSKAYISDYKKNSKLKISEYSTTISKKTPMAKDYIVGKRVEGKNTYVSFRAVSSDLIAEYYSSPSRIEAGSTVKFFLTNNEFVIRTMSSDLNSCANSDSVKIKLKDIPGRYNVTLSYTGGGGFASLDPREISKTDWGIKGAKFNLYKTTCKGSKFKEWKIISGKATITNDTLILTDSDVEIQAVFEIDPDYATSEPEKPMCTVGFDPNGGSGTMKRISVEQGSYYTLPACTFIAPKGKEFDKWDKGAVGAKITVTANTTIKAIWKDKSGSSSPEPSTPTDPTTPTDPADPAKPTDPTEQTKPTDTATDSSKQVAAEDSTAAKNAEEKAENINKKQKNTSISKLKAGKKSITISWKKLTAKDIKGYEIQYSTDKAFKKDVKTVNIGKTKRTSKTIKKFTSKKKYYVRIRTYKKSGGEKIYSKWSKSKSVKVK
ncbi:fibronectin type III domain-containing protein [Butyrivibrio sp. MB2005]|uniref:fibronectin type III domain-containing protein n=1 Tax=Butyrivibrio sp. MB2005 TaxID=1280678 RepID=UPI0004210240|nr:fibronectin type III domain-containing protein [Butyrivibrio sp. MB2005]